MPSEPILVSFYGDDFTGTMSTAEVLTEAGIPTAVFTRPPSLSHLESNFPKVRAVGIAGTARSLPVNRMKEVLAPVLRTMKEHLALTYLYKVCSTFDSSPYIGSIGRAIETAREIFSPLFIPILPAAPRFGRYLVFGTMFAALGKANIFRLDRHPSISSHPVTPMKEADLISHLAMQTDLTSGLVNILDIERGVKRIKLGIQDLVSRGNSVIFFDCLSEKHLRRICRAIMEETQKISPAFFVGSHEAAHGLACFFRKAGFLQPKSRIKTKRSKEGVPLFVISGSCATVTGDQIDWARNNGFGDVAIRTERLLEPCGRDSEKERVINKALAALANGRSMIAHTAMGPDDERIFRVKNKASKLGLSMEEASEIIGGFLGDITASVVNGSRFNRLIIAGGDTSGRIQKELQIEALQISSSVGAPAPLCYAYSKDSRINGMEMAFKGGQTGEVDYFKTVQQVELGNFITEALGS